MYPSLRCNITLTSPGPKSRQDGATDKASKSPTLLNDVNHSNRATLRVRNLSEVDSKGSKEASGKHSGNSQPQLSGTTKETRLKGMPLNKGSIYVVVASRNSVHICLKCRRG